MASARSRRFPCKAGPARQGRQRRRNRTIFDAIPPIIHSYYDHRPSREAPFPSGRRPLSPTRALNPGALSCLASRNKALIRRVSYLSASRLHPSDMLVMGPARPRAAGPFCAGQGFLRSAARGSSRRPAACRPWHIRRTRPVTPAQTVAHRASPDYGSSGNSFTGAIEWVQVDLGVTPEDRSRSRWRGNKARAVGRASAVTRRWRLSREGGPRQLGRQVALAGSARRALACGGQSSKMCSSSG
jgi:hypothetical protein